MGIRKDMETPATSVYTIKTVANQLSGILTVVNRLAEASETLIERAAHDGMDTETEARLIRHAELQSDLLAEYREMFGTLSNEAGRVLLEMMRLALANPKDLYDENGDRIPIHELPDDVAATISDVSVMTRKDGSKRYKYKQWDKPRALSLVGKHFGLLKDVIEHSGPGGGPIEVHASTVPIDKLSIEGKRQILEILERELGSGANGNGSEHESMPAIDAESRLLPESSNITPSQSTPYVVPFPFSG